MVDETLLEQADFIGRTFGAIFLADPIIDVSTLEPFISAFAEMDLESAATEWPFTNRETAWFCLADLSRGSRMALKDMEELAWDYRRLFMGPGHKEAPPWGSVYTGDDRVLFGDTTLALRDWKRSNRIATNITSEPDDHIGYLLELIAWVATHRPELLAELLAEHMLAWTSDFFSLMRAKAQTPFYRALAMLTDASLKGMASELALGDVSVTS